jgi:hypothetical protein
VYSGVFAVKDMGVHEFRVYIFMILVVRLLARVWGFMNVGFISLCFE